MNTETADNYSSTINGTSLGGNGSEGTVKKVAAKAHEAVDKLEQGIDTGSQRVMEWHHEYGEMARDHVRTSPLAYLAGAFAIGYLFAKITR